MEPEFGITDEEADDDDDEEEEQEEDDFSRVDRGRRRGLGKAAARCAVLVTHNMGPAAEAQYSTR